MVSVERTIVLIEQFMKKFLATVIATLLHLPIAQAQEVMFDRVTLPTRENESIESVVVLEQRAGIKQLAHVYYAVNGAIVRNAIVSVEGKVAEEILEPFKDNGANAGEPWRFLEYHVLPYKDKAIIMLSDGMTGNDSVWVTDGTRAGTSKVSNEDIGPFVGSWPSRIKDSLVLISGNGTVKLLDLKTGTASLVAGPTTWPQSHLGYLADGRGYFRSGPSVYVSDGTVSGTQVIATISDPNTTGSNVEELDENDPTAIRVSSTGPGPILVTDGTTSGTRQVALYSITGQQLGTKLVYNISTPEYGLELWSLDLVTLESSLIKDIAPGSQNGILISSKDYMLRAGGKVFFVADDGSTGPELWVSDGTNAGTKLVKDIVPGNEGSLANGYLEGFALGGDLVFRISSSFSSSTWITDGTPEGTYELSKPSYSLFGGNYLDAGGQLAILSQETYGVVLDPTETKWDRGLFLRLLDPSVGSTSSAFLAIDSTSVQPVSYAYGRLAMAGEYFYTTGWINRSTGFANQLYVTSRHICNSDFKPSPGQCGCGIEEIAADSSGTIAQSNADSDGSAVCLTPIGPIFVPNTLSGTITGKLTQGGGRPDSLQLTIPASITDALQTVVTAPSVDLTGGAKSSQSEVSAAKAPSFKPQHIVSVVVLDKGTRAVKKLPLRRTTKGTLTVKLGRRVTAKQTLTFQYAVAAQRNGSAVLQTPYKKSGAIKLAKGRR